MELLKELTSFGSPSGREKNITEFIKGQISDLADEIYTDNMGNLVAHKKGNGKKLMFAAHCDEIGVVVTYIDDNGYIRFAEVGGLYKEHLNGRRVVFKNGTEGVISSEPENTKNMISKMFIDIGAASDKEAREQIEIGDMAVFVGDYKEQGNTIISKALDNRAGCYAMIEAMKKVKSENDLYFVFTTQEEVGLRGARTAAYGIAPDYAIAIDVTDTGDTPEADKIAVKLGLGAAVKVMDYSVICDAEVREKLVVLAEKNKVDYQLEVMLDGGTDAGVMHFSRGGVKTGGISIPSRYIHSPSEMINKKDLESVIKLIILFAQSSF